MLSRAVATLIALVAYATVALAQPVLPPNRVLTRIAFGTCAYQEVEQPIWSAVLNYKPELFLFAGDNVYGTVLDGKDVTDDSRIVESLTKAYARATEIPGMKAVRETVPHLAIWDDHDYGKNDGGVEFVHKDAAQKLFADFWKLPTDDLRRKRPGLFHAQTFGPPGKRVQVLLLDTRYFRSPLQPTDQRGAAGKERYLPDDSPEKTVLGAEQWAWLEAQLREPADLRLVVSSIQLVADGHGWERWGNLPRERQRFYDLVKSTNAAGVVVLSGDRHIGAIYRESKGTPYPIYDITSSGLTQFFSAAKEDGPNRIGALFGAVNFGSIDIDWWAGTVTLALRSMNGEIVRKQTIEFAELAPR